MKYFIPVIILLGFFLFFIAFFPAWRSRAIGLAVMVSVVVLLVPGLLNLQHARASLEWPTTKAVVVYAAEEPGSQTLQNGQGRIDPATGFVVKYQTTPNDEPLAYMYEVQGVKCFSNIWFFGQGPGTSGSWAYDILARYPAGTGFPVSYCPTDPDMAVLEPGINPDVYGLPVGCAAFILFALMVLAFTIIRR